jgi:hypothetical protein
MSAKLLAASAYPTDVLLAASAVLSTSKANSTTRRKSEKLCGSLYPRLYSLLMRIDEFLWKKLQIWSRPVWLALSWA